MSATEFRGFTPAALRFLSSLKRNNTREWFQAHRAEYERDVRAPLAAFVEEMDVRFAELAPEIVGDPKRSLFRIHRDVRFSSDKSPYKTNAACWFYHGDAGRGVGSTTPHGGAGFYIVDLAAPFSRNDCEGGAFTLTIESDDAWKPDYFAVFGVDTTLFGPNVLIPFVAASAFELRHMSSDPAEGFHSMVLPTAKVLPQPIVPPDSIDPGDLGGVVVAARAVPHPENPGPRGASKAKSRPRQKRRAE